MDAPTASPTLYASLLAFAVGASFAALLALLPYVAVLASVSAALSATRFGLAVVAELRGFPGVLAFLAEVATLAVFAVAASAAWFATPLADAMVADGARHGG